MFGSLLSPFKTPDLEKLLRDPDQTKLISTYYSTLMTGTNPRFHMVQERWASFDISITEEDCSEFCDMFKTSVITSRDRVIQLKIFYHSHLTPARLYKMGLSPSADCFRGCGQTADFLHSFWTCPLVHDFWVGIGSVKSSALGLPNIVHPKNCLLGIFGDLTVKLWAKRLLCILYFYEKKSLLLTWKGSETPTRNMWLKLVNDSLPLYKLTFDICKRTKAFHKIWGRWLVSPLILSPVLP